MTAVAWTVACQQRTCACAAGSDSLLRIPRFKKWAAKQGILFPKLDITCFEGLRGMSAKESLFKGDVVIHLPRTSALVIEPTTRTLEGIPDHVWKRQPWFMKLAMMLATAMNAEENSEYSGYMQSLPKSVDIPCLWPEEDIDRLQYPSLITSIKKQKAEWDELVDDVLNDIPDAIFDEKTLKACLSYVRSRSFSGPYIGSKLRDRIRLGILVLGLAACNVAYVGVNAIEPTVNAVLAVSTFNFLYEILLSRRLKVYLMAPGVDFMNHSCHVSCDLSYDYFADSYSVRVDKDYDAGEQVFISYGQKSNDELLQYFGFIENDNPYDSVVVEDGMLKMYRIFCRMASVGEGRVEHINNAPVTVHHQGIDADSLNAVKAWVKMIEADASLIPKILIEFCQQASTMLDLNFSSGDNARCHLINRFRKEKAMILTKCIEFLKEQKNRYIGW